jgi:hypothetical protein
VIFAHTPYFPQRSGKKDHDRTKQSCEKKRAARFSQMQMKSKSNKRAFYPIPKLIQ